MNSFRMMIIVSALSMQLSIPWVQAAGIEPTEPSQATSSGKPLPLPELVSPQTLQQQTAASPGTLDLVDIRQPDQFADYHIPGSRNVAISEVLTHPDFLAGSNPLVLIDRDGAMAMAVAGILSQKTQRPIRVLSGGLEAYWSATAKKSGVEPVREPLAPAVQHPVSQPETAPPPPAAPASPAKRQSAGC